MLSRATRTWSLGLVVCGLFLYDTYLISSGHHTVPSSEEAQQTLGSTELSRIFVDLRSKAKNSVFIACNKASALNLAKQLAWVLRRSGWNVEQGYSPFALDLYRVTIYSCSPAAHELQSSIENNSRLQLGVECPAELKGTEEIILAVGERTKQKAAAGS